MREAREGRRDDRKKEHLGIEEIKRVPFVGLKYSYLQQQHEDALSPPHKGDSWGVRKICDVTTFTGPP